MNGNELYVSPPKRYWITSIGGCSIYKNIYLYSFLENVLQVHHCYPSLHLQDTRTFVLHNTIVDNLQVYGNENFTDICI
jgi:hypothetical protein